MKKKTCECGERCTCPNCACGPHAAFLDLFGNPGRFAIVRTLRARPKTVTEIVEDTELEQTAVSHALRKLEQGGVVTVAKEGRHRRYTLDNRTVAPMMALIDKHVSAHRETLATKPCKCGGHA